MIKTSDFCQIHDFELYGDAIYLDAVGFSSENDSAIVKFSGNNLETLVTFNQPYLGDRKIYLFDNKLYYTAQSGIGDYDLPDISMFSFDLNTKENKLFIKNDFNDYNITNGILYIKPYNGESTIIYKYLDIPFT